jgi:hypothetical protein
MNLPASFAAELEKIAAQSRATWTPSGPVPGTGKRPEFGRKPPAGWTPPARAASGSTRAASGSTRAASGSTRAASRRSVREATEAVARGAARNLSSNPVAALVGGLTAAGLMTMTQRRDARQDKLLRGLKAIEKGEHSRRQRNRLVKTVAIAGLTAGISGAAAPVLYRKATKSGSKFMEDLTKKTRDALVEDIRAGVWTSPETIARQSEYAGEFSGKIEDAVRGIEPAVLKAVGGGMYGPKEGRWGLGKVLKGPPLTKEYFAEHGIPLESPPSWTRG